MLVAVISDTHLPRGSRRLPQGCVDLLAASDLILHGGDLSSLAFLDELRGLGPPVAAVHGNADSLELRELLPRRRVVEAGGARIGLVHDPGPRSGREDRLVAGFPGCDAVVYGHTHIPQIERRQGVWILNPGSPTERRSAPVRSILRLEVRAGSSISPELVPL